jgi:hypothetical protein
MAVILQPENAANMIGPWGAGGAWIAKPRPANPIKDKVVWDPNVAGECTDLIVGGFTSSPRELAQPGDVIDGKGMEFRPKISTGKVAIRRYRCENIARRGGLHQEALYIHTPANAVNLVVVLEDIVARNIAGGGILVQAGSSGQFIFRRCDFQLGASGYPSEFIIKTAPGVRMALTFENCIGDVGLDMTNGGTARDCIVAVTLVGKHIGAMPDWKALGVGVINAVPETPPVTPPAPVDPHADCNARIMELERTLRLSNATRENTERALAAMKAERDALVAKIAKIQEIVR